MDLLGDIGANDQLIATRTENQILKAKVESLTKQVNELTLQVAVLQAEVEIYRDEARHSVLEAGSNQGREESVEKEVSQQPSLVFQLPSHQNSFSCTPKQIISDLHGSANPTCVACVNDSFGKSALVTGGADSTLRFTLIDSIITEETSNVASPLVVEVSAPVVCMNVIENSLITSSVPSLDLLVAAGTMDGNVFCAVYSSRSVEIDSGIVQMSVSSLAADCSLKKHNKYVSAICWSRRCNFLSTSATRKHGHFLATASSDGTVYIYFVFESEDSERKLQIENVEALYFDDAITCLCFTSFTGSGIDDDIVLYAYVRNTPHLKVIRMPTNDNINESCIITTLHLNTSLFDDHVSFAVLDLKISADEKYIAAACDNHCHLILDNRLSSFPHRLSTIVRKLYGHTADCYSRPVVAWSNDGQYVYSNTQNESKLCIYSIASGKLLEVNDAEGAETEQQPLGHVRPIKDVYAHPNGTVVVTTSFDRKTILWVTQ